MTLLDYLEREGLTLEQFGSKIGRSAATVSRISRGVHRPDWDTMEAIRKVTRGRVMPNDFSAPAAPARAAS